MVNWEYILSFEDIESNLINAIAQLNANDFYLLRYNVSERSIAHKLAQYLTLFFPDYDVDCEYNANVEADNGKKYIMLLKSVADSYGLLQKNKKDQELVLRNVYPDIIIHKRGRNRNNLLIIEIKKSSSNISCEYDIEKLKRYTSSDDENLLRYSFGAFIYLGVEKELGKNRICWFKNGNKYETGIGDNQQKAKNNEKRKNKNR